MCNKNDKNTVEAEFDKTYKATTNAKGQATFKITKLAKKGSFTAKISFKGNSLYKAAAKSVKIKEKR